MLEEIESQVGHRNTIVGVATVVLSCASAPDSDISSGSKVVMRNARLKARNHSLVKSDHSSGISGL